MAIPSATADGGEFTRRVSHSYCRAIGGLGAGIALGEVDQRRVMQESIGQDHSLYARRAMVFSGAEIDHVDVIALGNKKRSGSGLVVHSAQVRDLLDGKAIRRMLLTAGCRLDEFGDVRDPDQVVAFFLKIGIAADGTIRGNRTTIRSSHVDMGYPIRATATGLAHSILGTTRTFISADTVHQAPPGGGLCACIVKVGGCG
jgi:cyanuric acid amidohydrolase